MPLNNVPLPGQNLLNTRDAINNNFSIIDAAFIQDHVDYGIANQGMHQQVTLVNNVVAPTYAAGNIGLFNQTALPTTIPDIWMARGTAAAFPITGYTLGGTNNGNGWTYLPSGLKMAWGRSTTGAGTNVTITYSAELTNFPGFTTANAFPQLTRLAVIGGTSNFVVLTAYNQTQFTVASSLATSGTNIQFAWQVIGI